MGTPPIMSWFKMRRYEQHRRPENVVGAFASYFGAGQTPAPQRQESGEACWKHQR